MINSLIKRGEVYWIKLPLSNKEEKKQGIIHQLQGTHPGIIISNNQQNLFSPLITIIPLTSQLDKIYPFEVLTNINNKKGKALVDQITTIDKKRISNYIGKIESIVMKQITKVLHLTLDLEK